jgi:hypothetical protein
MTKGRDHKDGYDRKYLETLIEENWLNGLAG